MKVLNICMNAPFTENYSYQDNLLTEYQQKIGHEVTIITSTKTRDEQGKIFYTKPCDKIMENGVRLIRIDGGKKICKVLGIYPVMLKYIHMCGPEVIFIHGLCSFVPMQAISYKRRNRDCIIVADNHQDGRNTKTKEFPFNFILVVYRIFWKYWIKDVDKVYGTTEWRKDFANQYFGIPVNKCDTLITGVDTDTLPTDRVALRNQIRGQLGVLENSFVFITGGKLDSQKKVIETINAFKRLESSRATLLVFGSVSPEIETEFYEAIEGENRIIYLNYLDSKQIKQFFIISDMGVFAGGHSVLWEEARGCGLPCILNMYEDSMTMGEMEGYIGVRNPSEQSLYEKMFIMLENTEKYEQLKKYAHIESRKFSYYTIAEKSLECAVEYGEEK